MFSGVSNKIGANLPAPRNPGVAEKGMEGQAMVTAELDCEASAAEEEYGVEAEEEEKEAQEEARPAPNLLTCIPKKTQPVALYNVLTLARCTCGELSPRN